MTITKSTQDVSPKYLLGALLTDGVSPTRAIRLAQGYSDALENAALHEWMSAMATTCLAHGWQEAALAMLASESEHQRPAYIERAEEALQRMKEN